MDRLPTLVFLGFPGGSDGEESCCNAGDLGLIPGLERSPGGGHGNSLQYSCLENPMDRGDWRGPWGRKESDTTEQLLLHYQLLNRAPTSIQIQLSPPQFRFLLTHF